MYIQGSNRYIAVAAFFTGAHWAGVKWLDGWQEFVSIKIVGNSIVGWPSALLTAYFDTDEVKELMSGGGSPELNARAKSIFFEKLQEFLSLPEADKALIVDRYRQRPE